MGDWVPVRLALPIAGHPVEVSHELSTPSYNCIGTVDEDGVWHCPNGFIYAIGKQAIMTFNPTHWREKSHKEVGRG